MRGHSEVQPAAGGRPDTSRCWKNGVGLGRREVGKRGKELGRHASEDREDDVQQLRTAVTEAETLNLDKTYNEPQNEKKHDKHRLQVPQCI